jgi:hypothetical protein
VSPAKGSIRGGPCGGAQTKALTDYGQNTASAEYSNYFNRLAGVSGQGLTAAGAANTAYNDALKPGIAANFQGAMTNASDQMAGNNALISGINNGVSNLFGLAGYTGLGRNAFASKYT